MIVLLISLLVLSLIHNTSSTLKIVSAQPTTSPATETDTTTTTTTCTNLAVTGITASGNDAGYPPSNTIDNNLNTRWSNNGIGSWIRADLGSQKTICSLDIAWYRGNLRQNNFVVSVSNDGNTFTNVLSGKSSGKTLSPEKYDITDVNARYVKVTVNGNTENRYASVTEIDVYGSGASQPPTSVCTNLPIAAVTASGDDGVNKPINVLDNNLNTRWTKLGIGSWIQLDLGVQKVICSIDVAWYLGNQRQNNFVISISGDGTNFNNIFTGKSSGTTLSPEKYDIPDVNARYVKITVNGNTQNNYASITEIDVYARNPPLEPPPVNVSDKSYDINVLVIKYFPLTADRKNIDINITGEVGDRYDVIKQKTVDITNNLISVIGKASSYLGYKNPLAKPALRYHVSDTIEHEVKVPFSPNQPVNTTTYPDYYGIMKSHDICNYVDNKNVREVWLFAYQGHPNTKLSIEESKMSGPFGDKSNYHRYNDMPLCKNTYVVFTFNYGRGTSEALESWGHQVEIELTFVETNGTITYISDLFRIRFQGPNHPQVENVIGRCGDVHNPPNARFEYDRANRASQLSDCLDWTPDSLGILSQISCRNWTCDERSDSDNPSLNFMIWNWQNLPGINNTKTYQGKPLRNLWDVYGDFDNVMLNSRKLTR